MSALRTVASALLILLGASLIALWAVAGVVVGAVEDGSAARGIAERALDEPVVVAEVTEQVADRALAALADAGFDAEALGIDGLLRGLIAAETESDTFREAVLDQVDDARAQIEAELTAEERAPGPLVITVDPNAYVNARVDDVPLIGDALPEVTIAPVPVEAVEADRFEDMRRGYGWLQTAQDWALWAGLAALVGGLIVTHRTRWFVAKAGLGVAAIAAALWLMLAIWGVDGIAAVLPGGSEGTAATALTRIVSEATVPDLQARLAVVAGIGAAVAAVFLGLALLGRRREA